MSLRLDPTEPADMEPVDRLDESTPRSSASRRAPTTRTTSSAGSRGACRPTPRAVCPSGRGGRWTARQVLAALRNPVYIRTRCLRPSAGQATQSPVATGVCGRRGASGAPPAALSVLKRISGVRSQPPGLLSGGSSQTHAWGRVPWSDGVVRRLKKRTKTTTAG